MKRFAVIPLVALAFAAACGDSSPTGPAAASGLAPGGPSFHMGNSATVADHGDILPTLSAPAAAATLPTGTVTVNWTAAAGTPTSVQTRTGFRFKIECSGTGCTPVGETDLPNSQLSYAASLTPGSYTAYVRGLGETSEVQTNPQGKVTGTIVHKHGSAWATVSFHVATPPPAKQNQTITFDVPAAFSLTYGDPHFSLSTFDPKSSSGLPLTFASQTPLVCAIVAGDEVEIKTAGTCTITASQAGNGDFFAAAPVSRSFTINKATLTVTAENKSKTYDGAAFSPFSAAFSGFVYTDGASVVGGAPGFAGTAVGAVNAGTYVITPTLGTLAAQNYQFAFVNGSLTINKAPLTVTADTRTIFYGAQVTAMSAWSATYSGFVNNEGESVLGGSLEFAFGPAASQAIAAASGLVPVGSYEVVPSGLEAQNYLISYVNGWLHIKYTTLAGHKFLQPINLTTPRSSFRIGSTIPVKFELYLADGVTRTQTALTAPRISVALVSTNTTTGINEETLVTAADAGTEFRYDPIAQQYVFNQSTKGWSAGTYRITATLDDGSTVEALVETRAK